MYSFITAVDLLKLCKKHKVGIADITIRYEMEYSRRHRAKVMARMRKIKNVMKEAIKEGINNPD